MRSRSGSEGEVVVLLVGSYFFAWNRLRDDQASSTRFPSAVTAVETDQPRIQL